MFSKLSKSILGMSHAVCAKITILLSILVYLILSSYMIVQLNILVIWQFLALTSTVMYIYPYLSVQVIVLLPYLSLHIIYKFVPVYYIVHIMYCVLFFLVYEIPNSHRILHRQNLPTLKTPSSFNLTNTVVKVGYCHCI